MILITYKSKTCDFDQNPERFCNSALTHACIVATIKRLPLVPDTVIDTVDASDGITSTALQAAQRYRQKYRQTARTAIRKAANEKKNPIFFNRLQTESRQYRIQQALFTKHHNQLI